MWIQTTNLSTAICHLPQIASRENSRRKQYIRREIKKLNMHTRTGHTKLTYLPIRHERWKQQQQHPCDDNMRGMQKRKSTNKLCRSHDHDVRHEQKKRKHLATGLVAHARSNSLALQIQLRHFAYASNLSHDIYELALLLLRTTPVRLSWLLRVVNGELELSGLLSRIHRNTRIARRWESEWEWEEIFIIYFHFGIYFSFNSEHSVCISTRFFLRILLLLSFIWLAGLVWTLCWPLELFLCVSTPSGLFHLSLRWSLRLFLWSPFGNRTYVLVYVRVCILQFQLFLKVCLPEMPMFERQNCWSSQPMQIHFAERWKSIVNCVIIFGFTMLARCCCIHPYFVCVVIRMHSIRGRRTHSFILNAYSNWKFLFIHSFTRNFSRFNYIRISGCSTVRCTCVIRIRQSMNNEIYRSLLRIHFLSKNTNFHAHVHRTTYTEVHTRHTGHTDTPYENSRFFIMFFGYGTVHK